MKNRKTLSFLILIFAGMLLFPVSCLVKNETDWDVTAFFTVTPETGSTATTFSFDASGSEYRHGQNESFNWNFGDGITIQNGKIKENHQYDTPGSYEVSVHVSHNSGSSTSEDYYFRTLHITAENPGTPTAVLTVEPPQGVAGTNFLFDASGSHDIETPVGELEVRWDWNGDGIWDEPYDTQKQMTHQFAYAGTYDIRIEVKDQEDLSDVTNVMVEVTGQGSDPCPGIPYVDYLGKRYNTVQIGNQCWFRENLDVGTMIPGNQQQTDNNIMEKYCYDNDPVNCEKFGGLYQWNEMMGYSTVSGDQGMCPPGWHVPNENIEWADLEIFLGGAGVAGGFLKGMNFWTAPNTGATNGSGFTALPGGKVDPYDAKFSEIFNECHFWASEQSLAGLMGDGVKLVFDKTSIQESDGWLYEGYSVRCIKDN